MPQFVLKPETVRALEAVSVALGIHEASFDMEHYSRSTSCGTTLCVAGHLAVAAGYMPTYDVHIGYNFRDQAGQSLKIFEIIRKEYGIDQNDMVWGELFYVSSWPEDLHQMYYHRKVEAGQERIRRFIERYGPKELPVEVGPEEPALVASGNPS